MTVFVKTTLFVLVAWLLASSPVFAIEIPNPLGTTDIFQFVDKLIDVLFTIGLPVAVIMILWSALQFLTSGGNPQKIQSAKNIILYALVGFTILLLAKGLVNFICDFFGATCP